VGGATIGADEEIPDCTEAGSEFEDDLGAEGELLGCNSASPVVRFHY